MSNPEYSECHREGKGAMRCSRRRSGGVLASHGVDPEAALDELPQLYALGLRLRRDGVDDAGIAARLDIEVAAVPSLLHIAEAKLARIVRDFNTPGRAD